MAILITGGAGYIGSHTVAELLARNEEVVIVDNLQQGHRGALLGGKLYVGDLRDANFMETVFNQHSIDAVIHFAASALVGESMVNPAQYYDNNVYGTLSLLKTMNNNHVKNIIFSSTAATYGEPSSLPIIETDSTLPINPYGETKLAIERMMRWFNLAHGTQYVVFRYFNAAGAHESGQIGEDHSPETHLIPMIFQVALGQRSHISVYGDQYATPDGTCIRDFVHVTDLADAHIRAVEMLREGGGCELYNLGSGYGYSVKEVIEVIRKVTGHPIPMVIEAPRFGDPAMLIASSKRARTELNWKPRFDNLELIIASAWRWHEKFPHGYI